MVLENGLIVKIEGNRVNYIDRSNLLGGAIRDKLPEVIVPVYSELIRDSTEVRIRKISAKNYDDPRLDRFADD